jgi:F0F1-type ATP synthase membrane subunit b/b'
MEALTINDLVRLAVIVAGLWGFFKVVNEIVKSVNERHDREQRWDDTAENLRKAREEDTCQYNAQLAQIRMSQEDIREEFDGKVQEIKAEQYIIVECLRAVLDGLHQQGCNGKVSEALETLDSYMCERAHK